MVTVINMVVMISSFSDNGDFINKRDDLNFVIEINDSKIYVSIFLQIIPPPHGIFTLELKRYYIK